MRKLIIFMNFILLNFVCFNLNIPLVKGEKVGNLNHGHDEFTKVKTDPDEYRAFLDELSDEEIKNMHGSIRRRFIGWSVAPYTSNTIVHYEGDTVFAKSNNTSQILSFNYQYETETVNTTSVTTSGSISPKVSGKIGGVNVGLDAAIRYEIGKKEQKSVNESTRLTFIIKPYSKLTITIKGDGVLNNGAGRYYFFGICFKKGEWEYIDVINEYYDFYEEVLH